jgi:hypothetical protein
MRLTILYLTVVILIFTGANDVLGQSQTSREQIERFVNQEQIFMNLSKDLSETLRGIPGDNIKIMMRKQAALDMNSNYLLIIISYFISAREFLMMYDLITDPYNKEIGRVRVNEKLNVCFTALGYEIERINSTMAEQEHPAIIAIGMRMKDELRKGQELLRSAIIK